MNLSRLIEETARLKKALALEGELIGVSYRDVPDASLDKKASPCGALLLAYSGIPLTLGSSNCTCSGGIAHLGLEDRPLNKKMMKMLVEGEKLWCNLSAANRSFLDTRWKKAPPPTNIGDYVNIVPVPELHYLPDLIISLCNVTQASRFITLCGFQDGKIPSVEVGGSLCWSAITYPTVSGNFNVTPGDYSARRMWNYDQDKLIVCMPLPRYRMILESIDDCIAGLAAPSEEFEELTEKIKKDQ